MDRIEMQGSKGISPSLNAKGPAPVAQAEAVPPVTAGVTKANDITVTSLASAGSEAPVDNDRVTEIRRAVEQGTYPIVPTRIADAMIAAGYLLRAK